MEAALDYVSDYLEDQKKGQGDLFGDLAEEEKNFTDFQFKKIADIPNMELLNMEKECIGCYVSGHPLEDDADLLKKYQTAKTTDFYLDEETGEIIPSSKKRGRQPNPDRENKNETNEKQASGGRRTYKQITEDMQKIIDARDEEIKELKAANRKLKSKLNRITSIVESDD